MKEVGDFIVHWGKFVAWIFVVCAGLSFLGAVSRYRPDGHRFFADWLHGSAELFALAVIVVFGGAALLTAWEWAAQKLRKR